MPPQRTVADLDQFARLVGIKLTEIGPGAATAELDLRDHHLNGMCTTHGGAIFTLADLAFAAACNSHGVPSVAINANINYLKAARSGLLRARATEVDGDGKIAACNVVVTDEQGDAVAVFQGLAYRKGPGKTPKP